MAAISVNKTTCIKCGKCVRVCPSSIFAQKEPKDDIGLHHTENCIVCGHCAAICPTGSVVHADFPETKVHKADRSLLPSPEQVMMLCKARRSNRAISKKPVPADMLDMILEAAHRAPTASNAQQVGFTLVTDPAKILRLSELTIEVFGGIAKRMTNPLLKPVVRLIAPEALKLAPRFKALEQAFANGNDMILRGATAVLLIHAPAESRFGCEDSNLAYQNASLMAESLGVAQFYTGFVLSAIKQDRKRFTEFIADGRKVYAGMALGMPDFNYPNYIDKKDIILTRI